MDVNDQNLTRYLLGDLAEPERSDLEERYFNDPQLFERLVEVENKLVDDYARGELPTELRTQFENAYLTDPVRRERLKFASALVTRLDGRSSDAAAAPPAKTTWWQNALAKLRGRTPVYRYALALSSLVILLFAAWFVFGAWRRQRDAARLQAEATRQERERTEQRQGEQKPTPDVAGGQNVNQQPTPPTPVPSVSPTPTPEEGPRSVTLALTFGGVRGGGGGQTPTLMLAPATTQVRLVLALNDNDYPAYRASLQNADGAQVYQQPNVKPSASKQGATFVFTVPAQKLPPGEYVLKLSGINPDGEIDDLSKSPFRIVRK